MHAPVLQRTEQQLRDLVRDAASAPSSHNTQPWRFVLGTDCIRIMADRGRALPVNDPVDRELTISCGAAVFSMRVAAGHAGLATKVTPLPDPRRPDIVADVEFVGPATATGRDVADLYASLQRRRTQRGALDGPPDCDLVADMEAACTAEGIWFQVIPSTGRRRLADLIAAGDRIQFADRAWRRELAAWIRPRSSADGLPASRAAGPIARAVVRNVDLGTSAARRDRRLALTAPLLAVVGTDTDGPADWFRAGQGLQRLLLVAAGRGVQAGFLNQPCQVSSLRPGVTALLDHPGAPQVILRLGTTHGPVGRARRRPVDDVLIDHDAPGPQS